MKYPPILFVSLFLGLTPDCARAAEKVPVTESVWMGFPKQSFTWEGHPAFVVLPATASAGRPWIWRTSFPTFHPEVDLELLKRGFHVAHVDVVAMLGADVSLEIMDRFYAQVRRQWTLAEKPALEAVSRGGLHAYRYAARHPERIACIYADTPVMDLKSWPLKAANADGPLRDAQKYYGLASVADLRAFAGNPLDMLEPIARARIPLRHIISPNDRVVPAEENTLAARTRLKQLGWDLEVVTVDAGTTTNGGHHFPLVEVEQTVRFVVKHAVPGDSASATQKVPPR